VSASLHLDAPLVEGAGSAGVESLTSYMCGVATANRISTNQLLCTLFRSDDPDRLFDRRRLANRRPAINGSGATQQLVLEALEQATGRPDVSETCLWWATRSFAGNGFGLHCTTRRWCGPCYLERRRNGGRVCDLLAWHISELAVCPLHRCPLADECPRCRASQPWLPLSGMLDICTACGGWLGYEQAPRPSSLTDCGAYQNWLLTDVEELLRSRYEFCGHLTGDECSRFLRALLSARALHHRELSQRLSINHKTYEKWISLIRRPTLANWFRVCARVGVSTASTLIDPERAGAQLPLLLEPVGDHIPLERANTRALCDKHRIREEVKKQLDASPPTVSTITELAAILGVSPYALRTHARADVLRLATRLRRDKDKRSIRQTALRVAIGYLRRAAHEGRAVTNGLLAREISSQVRCSGSYARHIAERCLRSPGDQLEKIFAPPRRSGRPRRERKARP